MTMHAYTAFCCCRHFVIRVLQPLMILCTDFYFFYWIRCFSLLSGRNLSDPSLSLQIRCFCVFLCSNIIGSWHTVRLSFGDMAIVESVLLSIHSVSCYVFTYSIIANILKTMQKSLRSRSLFFVNDQ